MNRHLGRIVAVQSLFEHDFRENSDINKIRNRNILEFSGKVDEQFVSDLIDGVIKNLKSIDKEINHSAPDWPINQISYIDKSILRLSIYELAYQTKTPSKVVINEAVELAKEFGGENSSKFINGVLGTQYAKVVKKHESG